MECVWLCGWGGGRGHTQVHMHAHTLIAADYIFTRAKMFLEPGGLEK